MSRACCEHTRAHGETPTCGLDRPAPSTRPAALRTYMCRCSSRSTTTSHRAEGWGDEVEDAEGVVFCIGLKLAGEADMTCNGCGHIFVQARVNRQGAHGVCVLKVKEG